MTDPKRRDADRLLPLSTPVFQILISLSDKELHGYAIIKDVEIRTKGAERLSTSTLYGAIKRMLRDGLIARVEPAPAGADERRRYYRITDFGREVADREAGRIRRLAMMVRGIEFLC